MFGRRAPASAPAEAYAATATGGPFYEQMAIQSNSPTVPSIPQFDPNALTAGWQAAPVVAPWQQIGAFNGRMLNQFPARLEGVQLHSGREWGNSAYYTPYAQPGAVGNGGLTQTTRPNNIASAQRYGSIFQGPIGPLSATKMQADVVAAQIRQSGVSMLGWAKGLTAAQASQGGLG